MAGEVFVEITKNAQFPGFGISRRGGIGVWLSQKTGPVEKVLKNCNSETRSWRPVIYSKESGKPRWKFWPKWKFRLKHSDTHTPPMSKALSSK